MQMASENTPKKSPAKTLGHLLVVLSIPILVIVALLLNMKNVNMGIAGLLLGFAAAMLVIGSILSLMGKMGENRGYSPLFSYFLKTKSFLILYTIGFLLFIFWLQLNYLVGDNANIATVELQFFIFAFLSPMVYVLVKRIFREFEALFEKTVSKATAWRGRIGLSENYEFAYLFAKETELRHYRRDISKMLNDPREKYVALGTAFCLILPLIILQDIQQGPVQLVFSGSMFPSSVIAYSFWAVYWATVISLLLSVVWMIITATRALLYLEREKPHLHITQALLDLQEFCKEHKEKRELLVAKIDLLDLSFRRFKAGLLPIVNFILSLSLKIAFVAVFCSLPALVYFLFTQRVVVIWYSLCAFSILLSIIVFVVGQYGVHRLWSVSRKDAIRLLNHVCHEITDSHKGSIQEKTKAANSIRKLSTDLSRLSAITYTSSSIFKVASVNFLAFGPIIIEQILIRMVFK